MTGEGDRGGKGRGGKGRRREDRGREGSVTEEGREGEEGDR